MELDFQKDPSVLSRLVDDLALGFFSINASGYFMAWSKGAEQTTGYSRGEVLGRPYTVLDASSQAFSFVLDLTKASCHSHTHQVAQRDSRFLAKDGAELLLHFDVTTILNDSGLVDGAAGCFSDVTELLDTSVTVGQSHKRVDGDPAVFPLLGKGSRMMEVQRLIQMAGQTDQTVFLLGEPGTGKTLAASTLHHLSQRKLYPFVSVNCSNIPEHVLEHDLFGYVAGAFPGAACDKIGKLAAADLGTLFVDDIDHLSHTLLSKLLEVVQTGFVRPVGATDSCPAKFRLIAAACYFPESDLLLTSLMSSLGKGFTITLPPLRDQLEDLPVLCDHFMRQFSTICEEKVNDIDRDAMLCMMNYTWPGNVKELSDAIQQAFATVRGNSISLIDLPKAIVSAAGQHPGSSGFLSTASQRSTAPATIPVNQLTPKQAAERSQIMSVLQQTNGNKTAA